MKILVQTDDQLLRGDFLIENSIKFLHNYFCDKFSEVGIQIIIISPSNYTLFWLEEKKYFRLCVYGYDNNSN
jgi:hypothetical protein